MRTIKFRMWHKDSNYMEQPYEPVRFEEDGLWRWEDIGDGLDQFTGLKDKNGVEIYEGDILKYDDYYFCSIIWDEREAKFSVSNHTTSCFLYVSHLYGEVIGNIHQNPELL